MSEKLPYAQLTSLETAVQSRRVIECSFKGRTIQAEPHRIFSAPRTGAIVARCWLPDLGWRDVPYCEMRALEVGNEPFAQREIPHGRGERLA